MKFRKINLLLICVMFLGVISGCGCNSGANYYFYYDSNSITMKIGENINLYNISHKSNITKYDSLSILSSDKQTVSVFTVEYSNWNIKALKTGKATLTIDFVIENRHVKSNIDIIVENKTTKMTYNGAYTDNSDIRIYKFVINKNNISYANFQHSINIANPILQDISINNNIIIILCNKTANFILTITDNEDNSILNINSIAIK